MSLCRVSWLRNLKFCIEKNSLNLNESAKFSMERAMNGSYLVCSEQTKVFTKQKLKENTWVFISGEIKLNYFSVINLKDIRAHFHWI